MKNKSKLIALFKIKKFIQNILLLDFEPKSMSEKISDMLSENRVPIRKQNFREPERVFERTIGIHTIFVCTSLLAKADDVNDEDYIWIGMKTLGNPHKFFWFPLLRLGNFDEKALDVVAAFIELALKMPVCSECGQELVMDYYPDVMHLMGLFCYNEKYIHRTQNTVPYAVFDIPTLSDASAYTIFNGYQKFYESEYIRQNQQPGKEIVSARKNRSDKIKEQQARQRQLHNQYGDFKDRSEGRYFDGPHNDGF